MRPACWFSFATQKDCVRLDPLVLLIIRYLHSINCNCDTIQTVNLSKGYASDAHLPLSPFANNDWAHWLPLSSIPGVLSLTGRSYGLDSMGLQVCTRPSKHHTQHTDISPPRTSPLWQNSSGQSTATISISFLEFAPATSSDFLSNSPLRYCNKWRPTDLFRLDRIDVEPEHLYMYLPSSQYAQDPRPTTHKE